MSLLLLLSLFIVYYRVVLLLFFVELQSFQSLYSCHQHPVHSKLHKYSIYYGFCQQQ